MNTGNAVYIMITWQLVHRLGQNKNIVCLPKRDRPKKIPPYSNSFIADFLQNFFFSEFLSVRVVTVSNFNSKHC